jgi:hypothetical protein
MTEHTAAPKHTNRLAREKSPYLLQHAHNPVDWFPWGPEAFEKARVENKPVFLSVGYSACHWCHVMERESFESEEMAAVLNERFVSIKVDREERPDVDEVYMTAVQMMTGHGGWPMSVFMLPDGRPFYGGTYYPPASRGGRIGFRSLVEQLSDAYRNRPDEVEQVASALTADLEKATRQRPLAVTSDALEPTALLESAVADLEERFDAAHGGFGGPPKFPPHHALRLLCEAVRCGDNDALPLLTTTLDRMALGGLFDHIGGGFHRYSTDAVWLLPHFEKMLYDNALLARVYAEACEVTGNEAYARVASETCDWALRDLLDPAGGFQAALDADSEGEEGKYYVWTPEEVSAVLGAEAGTAFCARYNIVPGGNFRDEATGHQTGASIPHLSLGPTGVVLPGTLDSSVEAARAALLAERYKRVPPGKDDKVITAWNGLMIGALSFAGRALEEPRYLDAARRAADFCLTTLRPEGRLLRRYAKGEAAITAYLDDHAFLADGLLDLYDATEEDRWLREARALADVMLERFWDPEDGGFFYTASDHEALIAATKDLFDGALPSANGVAARMLTRLGNLPEGTRYADKARQMLNAYHGLLVRAPQGTQTLILAALDAFPEATTHHGAAATAPVSLRAESARLVAARGGTATAVFILTIAPEYHVNSRHPDDETLIPTVAVVATDAPASVGPVAYPEAREWRGPDGEALPVYMGEARFTVPIAVAADAAPGTYQVGVTVRYQPCSETACLAPAQAAAEVTLEIR